MLGRTFTVTSPLGRRIAAVSSRRWVSKADARESRTYDHSYEQENSGAEGRPPIAGRRILLVVNAGRSPAYALEKVVGEFRGKAIPGDQILLSVVAVRRPPRLLGAFAASAGIDVEKLEADEVREAEEVIRGSTRSLAANVGLTFAVRIGSPLRLLAESTEKESFDLVVLEGPLRFLDRRTSYYERLARPARFLLLDPG